jgi:ABC-type transport system substrate-binding protein
LWIAWRRAEQRETPARSAAPAIERAIVTTTATTSALRHGRAPAARAPGRAALVAALAAAVALTAPGCGRRAETPRAVRFAWVIGRVPPRFDPDGPPDPVRWAIERLLTRGLGREDSSSAVVPAAARRVEVSDDSLVYTFRLPGDLDFTDGTPCRSAHFREALVAGLARTDHGTRAWLLAAVRGVDRVRAGRPLPPLGIETPDDTTLVVRLARPDRALLARLALPGASDAWRAREARGFADAVGLGPWRVARADSTRRLTLVRAVAASSPARPDTIDVRFFAGASRVRSFLRQVPVDLTWPLPPALLDEALPPGYRTTTREARPARRLLLVMRADLPPTSRLPARHALAHGLNRPALLRDLGERAREAAAWIPGAPPFDFPRLDAAEARLRMEDGRLGRSFHVDLAYDADGAGAAIARAMQGEWARLSIYVELVPLRGEAWRTEQSKGLSHLLLVESQAPLDDAAAELATLVMPMRGPAVGGVRTGWRTRDLDAWILGAEPWSRGAAAEVQQRLEQDRIVVPLADLPWVWVAREGGADPDFHPHFGPSPR